MHLLWPDKKKKPDSGDWMRVAGSWPIPTQLAFPLAREISAYNSVRDLAWKAAVRMELNQEGRTEKITSSRVVPWWCPDLWIKPRPQPTANLKSWFLRAVWKKNSKLLIIQSILVYTIFALGFLIFFSFHFYPFGEKPTLWMLQIKTAFPIWTGIETGSDTPSATQSPRGFWRRNKVSHPTLRPGAGVLALDALLLQWLIPSSLWHSLFFLLWKQSTYLGLGLGFFPSNNT